MKRFLLIGASVLSLAACGQKEATVTYKLDFKMDDSGSKQELLTQALTVMEGRLQHIQGNTEFTLVPSTEGENTYVTATVEAQEVADQLLAELTTPIKIRIMAQTVEGETPDLTLEGTKDGYIETGVTEQHVKQIVAAKSDTGDKGVVQIQFTDEGHKKLGEVSKKYSGRTLGIFVREQPMRLFKIQDYKGDDLTVDNAPSFDIARIFSYDVNVSLYVTFSVVPNP